MLGQKSLKIFRWFFGHFEINWPLADRILIQPYVWKNHLKIFETDLSKCKESINDKKSISTNCTVVKVHILWEGHKNMTKSPSATK